MPFTVGQAFRQGDVPAGSTVLANTPNFQAVVKNVWPDGSAKYAILSGRTSLSANTWTDLGLNIAPVPASQTAVSTADLAATGATASVQFASFGTASWSASDWATPFQTWVSGPQMSSWIYRKPIGTDPHLVAWLEVRAYRGGQVEVLPWIENSYLQVPNPAEKSGTATFTLSGTQRFSQPLDLLNHQRAVLASGTTLTYWIGGDPQVTPRPSSAYLMSTKLVPNYRGNTSSTSTLFGRLATSYTPLAQADYPPTMGATGYHPSIGLLPEWDVSYLTTGGDPRSYRAVVIDGYSAGRYGTHYRDETTNRPLSFASYPNLVMDQNQSSGVIFTGASSTNSYTPTASGATPPTYDSPHHPSMGYMAYLLTGWDYFLEETQLLATANFLKNTDIVRQGSQGVFVSSAGANITRGAAWSIRTLAQAATITPDADPLRAQFVNSLNSNISFYYGRYVQTPNNPLGVVEPYDHYGSTGPWQAAIWMDDFFSATFAYLKEMQDHSSSVQLQLDQFLTWKFRSVVGRLGGSSADNAIAYPYAAQYTVAYAPSNSANWINGTGPWYSSWADVAKAMNLPTTANASDPLNSGYPTDPTAYWGNLMPALSYAVDQGATGAAAAWSRVNAASNFPNLVSGFDDNPVWGVKPRTTQ